MLACVCQPSDPNIFRKSAILSAETPLKLSKKGTTAKPGRSVRLRPSAGDTQKPDIPEVTHVEWTIRDFTTGEPVISKHISRSKQCLTNHQGNTDASSVEIGAKLKESSFNSKTFSSSNKNLTDLQNNSDATFNISSFSRTAKSAERLKASESSGSESSRSSPLKAFNQLKKSSNRVGPNDFRRSESKLNESNKIEILKDSERVGFDEIGIPTSDDFLEKNKRKRDQKKIIVFEKVR